MPELPEVETVANGVDARVRGRRITSVWTSGKPQTFKSSESLIAETLTGTRIVRVHRVGKTIVMDVTRVAGKKRDAQFLVHLGMTGRLLVSQPEVPLPKHTHAVLTLDDKREVRFVDPRRFGRLSIAGESYLGPGAEPHHDLRGRLCCVVQGPQAGHQGGPAEPVHPARRGQHLR